MGSRVPRGLHFGCWDSYDYLKLKAQWAES